MVEKFRFVKQTGFDKPILKAIELQQDQERKNDVKFKNKANKVGGTAEACSKDIFQSLSDKMHVNRSIYGMQNRAD